MKESELRQIIKEEIEKILKKHNTNNLSESTIGSTMNTIWNIPKQNTGGYFFNGSWATILNSALNDMGIKITNFKVDKKNKKDYITIEKNGKLQTLTINKHMSVNDVKKQINI